MNNAVTPKPVVMIVVALPIAESIPAVREVSARAADALVATSAETARRASICFFILFLCVVVVVRKAPKMQPFSE